MTARRRCALALTVLGAALIALLLTPGPPAAPGRPATARAAVARTVVVAKHTHTHHTSSDSSSDSNSFPCSSRFTDWFPGACPPDTPTPGPTFSFTNSANDVSIPPTATPRPVQTSPPTPQDTPYPTDLPVGAGDTTTSTTSTSSSDLLPATGGRSSGSGGGATGLWVLGGLVLLVLLGGTAGLAVLRLR